MQGTLSAASPGGCPSHGVSVGHKMGHKGTAAGPGDPSAVLRPLGPLSHSDLILHVSSQPFLAHRDGRGAANKRGSQQSPVFTCPVWSMTPKAESTALAASAKTGPVTAAPQPSPSRSHALNVDGSQQPVSLLASRKVPCPLPISQECKHSAALPQCTQSGGERQRSSALLLNMVLLPRGRRQPHALLAGGGGKEARGHLRRADRVL